MSKRVNILVNFETTRPPVKQLQRWDGFGDIGDSWSTWSCAGTNHQQLHGTPQLPSHFLCKGSSSCHIGFQPEAVSAWEMGEAPTRLHPLHGQEAKSSSSRARAQSRSSVKTPSCCWRSSPSTAPSGRRVASASRR